jgi:tetratricopeptide (TPR) repeat protein
MSPRCPPLGFALAALLSTSSADAQTLPQEPAAIFRVGIESFEAGNFRVALAAFTRVFELRGNPDLLLNIYRCHRAMGDPAQAALYLRRYLLARPDRVDRAELEVELTRLDAQARALVLPTTPPPTTPPPTTPPPEAPSRPAVPPRAAPRDPGVGPWITVGLGAALMGAGVGLMVVANNTQSGSANASSERARQASLDGASTENAAGVVMLGVGGAAVLGGVLWRVLAPRAPAVDVVAGRGQVSLSLTARWP